VVPFNVVLTVLPAEPCRFYFLSNDELLEILSEAKDPLAVQPFVKKCFEAVKELVFEANGEISGMISQEGEKITFTERVNPATSGAHAVRKLGGCRVCGADLHVLDTSCFDSAACLAVTHCVLPAAWLFVAQVLWSAGCWMCRVR
jgi:hypothetical protein